MVTSSLLRLPHVILQYSTKYGLSPVYGFPSVIGELGTSDHMMVLLVPAWYPTLDTGMIQKIVTRRMGKTERALFTSTLAQIRWEYLYTLPTCEEQFTFFQETVDHLLDIWCPFSTAQLSYGSPMAFAICLGRGHVHAWWAT